MKKPKVGDIWKDIWLDQNGKARSVDIFVIIETDIDDPRVELRGIDSRKGFKKKYLVANSGTEVGHIEWKYNTALNDFRGRTTIPYNVYNTPLYKAVNPEDKNES